MKDIPIQHMSIERLRAELVSSIAANKLLQAQLLAQQEAYARQGALLIEVEGELAKHGEWYDSLMEHCVKGYYKCEKCGGPVAEGLVCAWCGDTAPYSTLRNQDTDNEPILDTSYGPKAI